jgi:Peroxidase, family 2
MVPSFAIEVHKSHCPTRESLTHKRVIVPQESHCPTRESLSHKSYCPKRVIVPQESSSLFCIFLMRNQSSSIMRLYILSGVVSMVTAMPGMAGMHRRQLPLSQNEGNSGPIDSVVFNAQEQFVDVRPGTAHRFIAPGPNDKRGPCPGLNAAANHGFLPRSGITTIAESMFPAANPPTLVS